MIGFKKPSQNRGLALLMPDVSAIKEASRNGATNTRPALEHNNLNERF